jgi:anti-sigma factor RsiW
MHCAAVRKQLNRYLDAELAPGVRREIELHLLACPACRQALNQLDRIDRIWAALKPPPAPEGFAERLMREARRRTAPKPSWSWLWLQWWREQPLAMRAAAGSVVLAGGLAGLTMGSALFAQPTALPVSSAAAAGDPVVRSLDFLGAAPAGSVEQTYLDWVTQGPKE